MVTSNAHMAKAIWMVVVVIAAVVVGTSASKTTDNWAIELAPGVDPVQIAEKHGHEYLGTVGSLKNVHLFRKKPSTVHGVTHPHHTESQDSGHITWFENQVRRERSKRETIAVSDPLYPNQWHLHTGSGNVHINVEKVWSELGITGHGVTVGVVDDGLDFNHPDLAPNYVAEASYDFNDNDTSPFPDLASDDHGTPAAGVAGARDNTVCGVGSAPRAGIAGIRLISQESMDAEEAAALNFQWDINQIYSNSWGPIDDGKRLEAPDRLSALALETGVNEGRKGLGSIFVWAGGNGLRNGDNCNYDGWANSRYTITVSAVDYLGQQAWYSEPCSMIVVCAPSSGTSRAITSTDLTGARGATSGDCTSSFGGTSAAAPLVAGVVALMLEANPTLTWRDVQGVLIESASKNNPSDAGWRTNGAGYHVNHKYGFGLIDAYVAVNIALSWKHLNTQTKAEASKSVSLDIADQSFVESTAYIVQEMIIEHVEVEVLIQHGRRGDLKIILTSPMGTESVLAESHQDPNSDIRWKFRTIFCWGEKAHGVWKLRVEDSQRNSKVGKLQTWTVRVWGHDEVPEAILPPEPIGH